MAAKKETIAGDDTGLQQRLHLIPHLDENIEGFPLKAKSFRMTATDQKLWGGVYQTSSLYHGGGMNLRVRPRVKLRKFKDRFHYQLSGFTSFLAGKPRCFLLGLNLVIR